MCTQSPSKPGTDSVPFYMDFGQKSKRFGRFSVSQISRKGQRHTEPTFQVFRKNNSGTFEKYQQLRFGDYEFQNFSFLHGDLLNGELDMRENQPQFDKKYRHGTRAGTVSQIERDQHWTKPQTLGYFPPIHQRQPSFNLCASLTFVFELKQVTDISYTLDEFEGLL